ncbi:right-handed parallel beta-helix repeat-containing protein [Paenibacillus puldeungensis]|uniref:Right-handed parallel beta-helix repeat-containing protein n=1 Tax=Paenibacillus puldeungensis TaxID=696536 RepID=A0ABW3RUP1_9BACL
MGIFQKKHRTFWLTCALLVCAAIVAFVLLQHSPLFQSKWVLDVKKAGAKGDGVNDDTDVFLKVLRQAADAGHGAEVIVPPGTYSLRLDEPLPLYSGVSIRGQGKPVLKFRSLTGVRNGFEAVAASGRHIRIDGIVIDGGHRLTRGINVHTGSYDVEIRNSVIRDLSQSENPESSLYSAVVSGIMIYGNTSKITISGCTITQISASHGQPVARGIMVWSEPGKNIARFVRIIGNEISHITPREDADGIYFDKPPADAHLSESVIEGNFIHHTAKRGIKISTPGVTVKDNHIVNPYSGNNRYLRPAKDPLPQDMYSAISIYASQVTVSGNTIDGTGSFYAAIEADIGPLNGIVIENNQISGGSSGTVRNTSGIRLGAVHGFTVKENTIRYVQTGIRLSETATAGHLAGTGKIADNQIQERKQ